MIKEDDTVRQKTKERLIASEEDRGNIVFIQQVF